MKRIWGTVHWGKFICSLWERAGESEYYVWLGPAVESTGPGEALSTCTVDWCRVDCTRESPTPGPVLPPHRWGPYCTYDSSQCTRSLLQCTVYTTLTAHRAIERPTRPGPVAGMNVCCSPVWRQEYRFVAAKTTQTGINRPTNTAKHHFYTISNLMTFH